MNKIINFLFIFSGLTFLSRCCGFVRDMCVAYFLGTGHVSDIFLASFRLPNLFRAFFAEGAVSSVLVPMYKAKNCLTNKEESLIFVGNILSMVILILIVFIILAEIFMPQVLNILAPGLSREAEYLEDFILYARLMFPFIILISMTAIFGAILQAENKFGPTAFAPIILNISMIVFVIFANKDYHDCAMALSFGVVFGGFIQVIFMIYKLKKENIRINIQKLSLSDDTKNFLKKILPSLLTNGVTQISVWINTLIASFIPGAISFIYYADRLVQLPLAMIGIALGNVILPSLSESIVKENTEETKKINKKAIEIAILLVIPASMGLFIIPNTIVQSLFMYNNFSIESAHKTAEILAVFAIALPAFVLNKIFITSFFARGDTKTPAFISLFCIFLNVFINLILIGEYQHLSIAIATTISSWVTMITFIVFLKVNKWIALDNIPHKIFYSTSIAVFLMALSLIIADTALSNLMNYGLIGRIITLAVDLLVSVGVYFYSLKKMGINAFKIIK